MTVSRIMAGLLVLAALLACKKSPPATAQVNCRYQGGAFLCDLTTTGETGQSYTVCWDIDVTCADGQKLAANTCMDMSGNGRASSAVPNSKFTGGACKVGAVTGVAVNNVKMTQKH